MSTQALHVVPASAAHHEGLSALFEAACSTCYCRYWHFEGDKNAWLERSACAPEESRAELGRALQEGSDEGRGLIALLGGEVVGWLKLAPASSLPKLYDQKLYRRLPCFEGERAGVFTVGCMLVHPERRRSGVARALIRGALTFAPTWGATALEALPRRPREAVSDEELWMGPVSTFLAEGFEEVNAFEPYPVLRRSLAPAETGAKP